MANKYSDRLTLLREQLEQFSESALRTKGILLAIESRIGAGTRDYFFLDALDELRENCLGKMILLDLLILVDDDTIASLIRPKVL